MTQSSSTKSNRSVSLALDYLRSRKTVLTEYRGFVRQKSEHLRSVAPDLLQFIDTGQAMTHDFLQYTWTSYVKIAEERFGENAVNLALRDIGTF
jgi:hypothetical protein